jgi:cell division protein FtsQ
MPRIRPNLVVAAVCLVLCASGSVWLWQNYLSRADKLPLRVVEIDGDFIHLERGSIQQAVNAAIADAGFFTLDMQALRQQVLAMPWVAEASVQRRWPDMLRIQVLEQVPVARWGDGALVNLQGDVFRPAYLPQLDNLPLLQGADVFAPRVVGFYSRLATQFSNVDLRVAGLDLNPRGEWVVHLANNLTLLLGRRALNQRVQDFLRVYQQLAVRHPQRIDMRYENGFAIRWQPTESES